MKWVPYPFDHDGGRMMAIGADLRVYVVGAWHAKHHFQGCVYTEGRWLVDSKVFWSPTGQDDARKWCEQQDKKVLTRLKRNAARRVRNRRP